MADKNPNEKLLVFRILHGIENSLLVITLLIMILLSFAQIVMRNFAETGLFWADAFLRYLVLWVGMLGAMVATREYNHINIDIVSYFLPQRAKAAARVLTDAFTAAVCGILTHAAFLYVKDEMAAGTIAFAKIPSWTMQTILPVAFGVIALRYGIYTILHAIEAIRGKALIVINEPVAEDDE